MSLATSENLPGFGFRQRTNRFHIGGDGRARSALMLDRQFEKCGLTGLFGGRALAWDVTARGRLQGHYDENVGLTVVDSGSRARWLRVWRG